MGVELENQHVLSIVAEEGVAVAVAGVGTAAVPALAVEDNHRAGRGDGLHLVLDRESLRGRGEAALVRAGHHAGAADRGAEVVEHPHRIHHHRRVHVEHIGGDVAVQVLEAVAGADDARVEAAQNQRGLEKVFEDGQDARVVDALVEDAIHDREVGHVAGRAAVGVFGAVLLFAADQGLAHGSGGVGIEDIFEQGEAVEFDFLDGLFAFVHRGLLCK